MFSYRHAYHAGNHADVLKHFVQVQLHQYMNQKEAAYTYIDTHSGAGVYALDSAQAVKSGESVDGIARLWERDDLPPALADYVKLVRTLNPSGKLRYYPGSPWVADEAARPQDRLRLFELHPADARILVQNVAKLEAHKAEQGERARGKRVIVDYADGFVGLKALLPPPSRRALVLIDPPYEVKLDYKHVRDALDEALKRFPSGTYAVWYPVLQRMESREFADRLKRLPAKEWLHVTLSVAGPRPDGNGLHSSGMFILNPPYTLEATLREVMPYLTKVLGQDAGATFRIERGTQLSGTVPKPGIGAAERAGAGRQPVGNARRASPLSGKGSLRLPGQPFGDAARPERAGTRGDGESGAAPARRAGPRPADGQGNQGSAPARPRPEGRPGQPRGAGVPSARPGTARAGDAAGPGKGPRRPAKRNG
ncbi:23S rRNA (adenine(2030)-N(6))-methyltransferase RlmJ [uncultured Massilia sp.]|uniref:23S rRNA (adenine(2030)-N(6))-methyltransferase RlmJ n=1 Tax=uncultured Massilia sp. TaxID=169973 RepID=UPI0025EE568A|nr:23S rRNA (adenine(2030)-N(6))-methyltransferase RlmJ [uncultured Massilia sp.]